MTIVRWEPARDFGSLQQEVNRVFSSFFDSPASSRPAQTWVPAMDLRERDDSFLLTADLPGVSEQDLAIDVEGDVLSLSGSRTVEHETHEDSGTIRRERGFGSFRRQMTLPEGVDADKITASFDRGVLEVRIPKPEKTQPRRVAVQIGDSPKTLDAAGSGDASTSSKETGKESTQTA